MNIDLIKFILLTGVIVYIIRYTNKAYKSINKDGFTSWFLSVEEDSPIGFSKGLHLIINIVAIAIGIFIFFND